MERFKTGRYELLDWATWAHADGHWRDDTYYPDYLRKWHHAVGYWGSDRSGEYTWEEAKTNEPTAEEPRLSLAVTTYNGICCDNETVENSQPSQIC
jgi:hypothetical protein